MKVLGFLKLAWTYRNLILIALLAGFIAWLWFDREHQKNVAIAAIKQRDVQTYVAETNRRGVENIQAHEESQAKARQAVRAAKISRDTVVIPSLKEIHNAPGNDAAAGPSWDALGDRLRELAAQSQN